MPLPERLIQPVSLSRGTLQYPVPDELEGVTNGTLANIIRQLSTLSRHAEEMFGNLFKEAEGVATRSSGLQARIDKLAVQVTQLDSTVEEVSLQDIHLRKAFQSSQPFDQQVVSRETMPKAMLEAYLACDKPPPLNKLNPYREDGKDGLKFYTDPTYFFELWRQEMLKDTERMMNDKGKKSYAQFMSLANFICRNSTFLPVNGQKSDRNKKKMRQPQNTTEKHRQKALNQGEYIIQNEYQFQQTEKKTSGIIGYDPALADTPFDLKSHMRPNSIDINNQQQQQRQNNQYQGYQYNPNQEPIYTPRILRSEQPSSPTHHPMPSSLNMPSISSLATNQYQHYQPNFTQQPNNSLMGSYGGNAVQMHIVNNKQQQQQQQPQQHLGSNAGTPTRRPNQPPPAPPPNDLEELQNSLLNNSRHSTREEASQRDSLPPPPPPPDSNGIPQQQNEQSPMQQLMQQLNSHHLNSSNNENHQHQNSPLKSHDTSDLPPPPPVPSNGPPNNLLSPKIPPEHLPPSPPPPPEPINASNGFEPAAVTSKPSVPDNPPVGAVPPPPPPPPPAAPGELVNGLIRNGDVHKEKSTSPVKSNGSPPKLILSPQGLKKPQQPKMNLPVQDGMRSDLLKAIRDGIALRKVEQNRMAKDDDEKGGTGQSDVASILARRVAVEMSDSDDAGAGNAPTDSEYDSDDWGDESQA